MVSLNEFANNVNVNKQGLSVSYTTIMKFAWSYMQIACLQECNTCHSQLKHASVHILSLFQVNLITDYYIVCMNLYLCPFGV